MRTSARRDGNEYVISGQKLWETGAGAKGNVINVYVKTDPKASIRQGMSLFLVDNTAKGLELKKLEMLGRRCTGTYEVFFSDVRVPAERLIGGENQGWDCILSGLQVERITSAAGNLGAAQACLDLAVEYAKERKQFGRPIGANQAIAHLLADMATEIEAARALTWRAAWMVSRPGRAPRDFDGEAFFLRSLRQVREPRHAGLRRLRLQHGVRHAAPLPRRALGHHRSGHFPDSA
jgi:alkylation response protein AidB-like acyl-CoA dehydrogenase